MCIFLSIPLLYSKGPHNKSSTWVVLCICFCNLNVFFLNRLHFYYDNCFYGTNWKFNCKLWQFEDKQPVNYEIALQRRPSLFGVIHKVCKLFGKNVTNEHPPKNVLHNLMRWKLHTNIPPIYPGQSYMSYLWGLRSIHCKCVPLNKFGIFEVDFNIKLFVNCYMRQCGAQMSLLIAYLDQTAFMFQDSNKFSWSFSSRFSLVRLGLTSFCIGWFFEGIRFKEVTNVSTSGMSTTIHHFLVSRQLNLKVQLLSFSIIVK